jgi:pimeloyl-ACP methyl ester carboxylesterase
MIKRLVLLPGMHGTGELFQEFMSMIPEPKHIQALCYPNDVSPSYRQLLGAVQFTAPESDPFFLLAESFSTPLAIQFAATQPANLEGLILCAGFASSPVRGWRRIAASLLAPALFHLALPEFASRRWLVGPDAPLSLLESVKSASTLVRPKVLSTRLRAIFACDVRKELNRVAVPILFVQATQDRIVPATCLEEIRRIKPMIEVAKIDGPHLILQRRPQESAMIVSKFIGRLSSDADD